MFAYPRYQTQPMYAYSPEEYYYNSGSEAGYRPYYEDSSRTNRYNKRRSSIKKLRRSKSFSKIDYSNYDHHQRNQGENEYYYQGQHRLDGVRSVSPFTENRSYHARTHQENEDAGRRNSWVQPTSFVNLGQPMINPMTNNYQMQQSLGACTTDSWPSMTTNAYIPPHNDLFFPPQNVPMIQPYYIPSLANNSNPFLSLASSASSAAPTSYYPQQVALYPNFMHMPILFPELLSNNTANNNNEAKEETTTSKEVTPSTSQKTSPTINTNQVPDAATDTAIKECPIKRPVVLHRKKSFMEGILSSFSLLEDVNYAPATTTSTSYPKPDDGAADNLKSTTWDPTSYTSLNEALNIDSMTNHPPAEGERKVSSLSRKTSTRLLQKANALQTRQYIWCYRPYKQNQESPEINSDDSKESSGLWAAFDMRNQFKLDSHHYFLMSMKNRGIKTSHSPDTKYHRPDMVTDDPHHILVLNKQSNISSPVMVSISDNVAWYNNPMKSDFEVLEIACMPTHQNKLVVSNDLIRQEEEAALVAKPLRRSKSMDGLASKLLNTVLGW